MQSPPIPMEIRGQVALARAVIERHLAGTLAAIHLYGSALDGGLKRYSDIDLLAAVRARLPEAVRRDLMRDLLTVSAPVDSGGPRRALEVTVVVLEDVVPWRHPARRELQFGEWLRQDLLAGVVEPPVLDHDLAILLTKARQHSIALVGPPAASLLDAVPPRDFRTALADTLAQWNTEEDWEGDERNILLALARIWYSAATGRIAPKDVAAAWALERLPDDHRPTLAAARAAYLDGEQDGSVDSERVAAFIRYARPEIESILAESSLRDPG
ncbi:AadA family aminoglycoside 3''-O-nucleotidyltransferase [Pigmentiphaga sp. H8]|uniref:AadA family aminoglycoside 3''-O-nucleotidyltransferase n=1 Tax=Pigmentiphaga sp. H8 TaxID=2488560 RepID=UPI000F5B3965|nr:AadA family aminoglycoside 3''-O-nucleotidyltransferase [Pigmentiphaga sp. H8]AZG08608.1 AadA family aminoglycoside 3''-O-nucleotidyltransferase [Pigmentiphaga sp. H8]